MTNPQPCGCGNENTFQLCYELLSNIYSFTVGSRSNFLLLSLPPETILQPMNPRMSQYKKKGIIIYIVLIKYDAV